MKMMHLQDCNLILSDYESGESAINGEGNFRKAIKSEVQTSRISDTFKMLKTRPRTELLFAVISSSVLRWKFMALCRLRSAGIKMIQFMSPDALISLRFLSLRHIYLFLRLAKLQNRLAVCLSRKTASRAYIVANHFVLIVSRCFVVLLRGEF